ncbi:MAG: Gx transporter family protein [Defluviitaleaceae bacterium]|nr:Gx transporter family protein [Defluviitaleaceae bacterium]
MRKTQYSTKKIAFLGLMLAVIVVLLAIERMLPPVPFFPPNFKLGLSNIIIMFAIFFMGAKDAFVLGVLKSFFNTLMRGVVGGAISLAGGMLSIAAIAGLMWISRNKMSVLSLSIAGAIFHNIGQIIVAIIILRSPHLFMLYLPVLLVAGVVMGSLTGICVKIVMPVFERIYK